MLASGVFLAYTYSSPVKAQNVLAEGVLNVPANSYQSIVYVRSLSGDYYFQVDTDMGTIQAFFNTENSTFDTWVDGASHDIWNIPQRAAFNGSSGGFAQDIWGDGFPNSEYLIFSNPDSFNKDVNYKVGYNWTYNNYFGLMAGIAITALGAIILFLTLLKNKLRDFNKALENQE